MRGCLCEGCSSRLISDDQCTEASQPKDWRNRHEIFPQPETCVQHLGWKRVEKRSASCWCQVFRMKSHEITAVFCAVLPQKFLQWIWQAPNRSGSHLNALGSKTPSKNRNGMSCWGLLGSGGPMGKRLFLHQFQLYGLRDRHCASHSDQDVWGICPRWPAGASPCWEKREKQN